MPALLLIFPILFGGTALIQEKCPPDANSGGDAAEREFERLTDTALAAPPEFAADMLLRLVESNAVKDRKRKIELLRQAFQLASGAKFPLMIANFMPGHSTDSDVGVLEGSLELSKLDTLSLRCRAVRQMLSIDKRAALEEFFAQIPRPEVPALTCKDAIGYSLDEFYALVAELANSSFTEKEVRDSKPALFAEGYVRTLASPFQVRGAAAMILAARVTDVEYSRLVAAFSSSLKSMSTDARSFSSTYDDVNQSTFQLAEACRRRGISGFALLDAYRTYIVKHMSASRCGEDRKQIADAPSTGKRGGQITTCLRVSSA